MPAGLCPSHSLPRSGQCYLPPQSSLPAQAAARRDDRPARMPQAQLHASLILFDCYQEYQAQVSEVEIYHARNGWGVVADYFRLRTFFPTGLAIFFFGAAVLRREVADRTARPI